MSDPRHLALTRDAARRLDAAAQERFGIPSLLLMENAASGICRELVDMGETGRVLIVCGPGNNGGDGIALARHLDGAGVDAFVALTAAPRDDVGDAATNLRILERMAVDVIDASEDDAVERLSAAGEASVIVDALFGTGLTRPIEGRMAEIVRWINDRAGEGARVVSIDIPSGLDADTGEAAGVVVRADATVTMVAPKVGFDALEAQAWLGEVRVVGIGTPRALLEELGTPRTGVQHPGEVRPAPAHDPGRRGRSVWRDAR